MTCKHGVEDESSCIDCMREKIAQQEKGKTEKPQVNLEALNIANVLLAQVKSFLEDESVRGQLVETLTNGKDVAKEILAILDESFSEDLKSTVNSITRYNVETFTYRFSVLRANGFDRREAIEIATAMSTRSINLNMNLK